MDGSFASRIILDELVKSVCPDDTLPYTCNLLNEYTSLVVQIVFAPSKIRLWVCGLARIVIPPAPIKLTLLCKVFVSVLKQVNEFP